MKSRNSESGFGASGIIFAILGVFCVWFVFLFILDIIRDGHSEKVRKRMAVYEAQREAGKKAKEPPIQRSAKGYRVAQ